MAAAAAQRFKPPQSSSITSLSDNRPTVVLCSSKDEHLLSQDICILCGSLGKDDEGNLISCSQCGQCYHPYCVNIKGLKVVVSKGWRCLDCTVCETCGQPGDEGKLLLCDECELSYHTYCLTPPLEDVPPGAWKCHWCVVCQKCGSHSPGENSEWQKNYTECGPCSSTTTCPKCHVDFHLTDWVLKCTKCSRWLHAECDSMEDEDDCLLAADSGYVCLLCRPQDETPLFILQKRTINRRGNESANNDTTSVRDRSELKFKSDSTCPCDEELNQSLRPQSAPLATSTEINSQLIKRPASSLHFSQNDNKSDLNVELNLNDSTIDDCAIKKLSTDPMIDLVQGARLVDGVYLSETGLSYIKNQKIEPTKRQRAKRGTKLQKTDDSEEVNKEDDAENTADDENKKKRIRKLSKAGIGGFTVRQRGFRVYKADDFTYSLSNDNLDTSSPTSAQQSTRDQLNDTAVFVNGKPKRMRRKPKKKPNIADQYPSYLQEAFFGKTLLVNGQKVASDKANDLNSSSNLDIDIQDAQKTNSDPARPTSVSKFSDFKNGLTNETGSRQGLDTEGDIMDVFLNDSRATDDSSENNQDILNINLDLVDPLDSSVVEDVLNGLGNTHQTPSHSLNDPISSSQAQLMSPSIRSVPDASMHYDQSPHMMPPQTPSPRMQFSRPQMQTSHQVQKVRAPMLDSSRMQPPDPYSIPPHTPRPMQMPQRSPFSPHSPYPTQQVNPSTPPVTPRTPVEQVSMYHPNGQPLIHAQQASQSQAYLDVNQPSIQLPQVQYPPQAQYSQQQTSSDLKKDQNSMQDWEADEALGLLATKSAILYANTECKDLKDRIKSSDERYKEIQKIWRKLRPEDRKFYVERARENRSAAKVNSKPDTVTGQKQQRSQVAQETVPMRSQQMHIVQQPINNQSQETRWRQPMPPVDRIIQSPHHMVHDPNGTQPMSPSVRQAAEPHFDPNANQMIPPQTPSPHMQYARPPPQQHTMIQVSRVRPPIMDRPQPMDPYSIPPSTPRQVPVQQRSPYSPQSPYPPITNTASSTPPVTPRTPNEQMQHYQNNQPQQAQQPYMEQQQLAQYQPIRQQYPNMQRLSGPAAPIQQYANHMPNPPSAINRPMSQQVRNQMNAQQPLYQQQQPQQYRQTQPVRYVSPHQDSHQLTNSPLQQNHSPQAMPQQRMQRSNLANQISHQQPAGTQRMMQARPTQPQLNHPQTTGPLIPSAQQVSHIQPMQHQMQSQQITQPSIHHQPQNQSQMNMQQSSAQTVNQQMAYSNVQISSRMDAEDSLPLLDDEDALRDLGADFNILEFADPEHEKIASTSSGGKNNIDLDPELEDFFDQDQLEEKRANEQLISAANLGTTSQQPIMHPNQQHLQSQQMLYQSQVQQHTSTNQSFMESQQAQASIHNTVMGQNQSSQYSPQRQAQFVNQQQRVLVTSNQNVPSQSQMIRQQVSVNQVRVQHPHQHHNQMASYVTNRPQQVHRYQSPPSHDMHVPQQMQQSHMVPQSQIGTQLRGNHQMQTQPHYGNSTNFVEGQAQQQSMHSSQMHHQHHHNSAQQQVQYSPSPHQNVVYSTHQHSAQINQPRRQFQSMPQHQQQQQQQQMQQGLQQNQNYNYQQSQHQHMMQHQHNYQQMPSQPVMRNSNELMLNDKNPIIGEPMTSMEFSMYEAGSGADNQAANFFESFDIPESDPDRQVFITPAENEQILIPEGSEQPLQSMEIPLVQASEHEGLNDSLQNMTGPHSVPETNSKFVATNSGRLSSCSDPQDFDPFGGPANNGDKSNNNVQGQNQLLKQLLATCPAADGPNQEIGSSSPNTDAKTVINASNNNTIKNTAAVVPNISFQLDNTNKPGVASGSLAESSNIGPSRPITTIGVSYPARPFITSTGVAPSSIFAIKPYNVSQESPSTASSLGNPTVIVSPGTPSISQPSGSDKSFQILPSGRLQSPLNGRNSAEISLTQTPPTSAVNQESNKSVSEATPAQLKAAAKISAAKQRKSDYMAKRRADLEKEPTPPPREVKPKKRVRGPNKRSRAQLDSDEVKTNDSNSNASETSQIATNGTSGSGAPPPRKRVRKSQKNKTDGLNSIVARISIDLPSVFVNEPHVKTNMNIGSMFSSGDLNMRTSKLRGQFGRGIPINNTLLEHSHNKGRRKIIGYYHEEFPRELAHITSDTLGDCLISRVSDRECDSPGSIISASSSDYEDDCKFDSEPVDILNTMYTPDLDRFKSSRRALDSADPGGQPQEAVTLDFNNNSRPISPSIPIEIKLPVSQAPPSLLDDIEQDLSENNKENRRELPDATSVAVVTSANAQSIADQSVSTLNMRLKNHGNLSVSLSLTTEEADGVKRVFGKMPDLVDAKREMPEQSPAVEIQDVTADSNVSVQLITGSFKQSHEDVIEFDQVNYSSKELVSETKPSNTNTVIGNLDVKPDICCRCRTVIINRGIRRNISDIPEHAKNGIDSSLLNSSTGDLLYCSVDCYATSLMRMPQSKVDPSDATSIPSVIMNGDKRESLRRKHLGISYTRWSPSFFEPNKITSPIGEEVRETVIMDNSTFTPSSSSQLINHGDSSIDSNESDNSTSYSQSTSGKLGNSLDSPSNVQESIPGYLRPRETKPRPSEIIPPWPEGLDLIQVRPYKQNQKIKDDSGQHKTDKDTEMYEDIRRCILCLEYGDGDTDGPARLLNFFIDGWVHLNCALWSLDVYELANGALMNVELACKKAMTCSLCRKPGATLKCFKPRCPNYYHFSCAQKEKCSFYEDKSVQCRQHSRSSVKELTSFVVKRRVYINRDEQKQVAEMIQSEQQNVMRVGSLVFLNIGQLLPHQLGSFHDQSHIFPVGFKVIRYYWSYRQFNKRSKYICTIEDNEGKPRFRIVAQEFGYNEEEFLDDSPEKVWAPIIDRIIRLRQGVPDTITTFRTYIRGEDLFGLTEPSIVRILESLPGVETLTDYEFKFGRSPLLELPLAINPTGCARTEPKLRTHFKRPYTIHTANNVTTKSRLQSLNSSDSNSPYIKQFVHSKSSQYRKMKSEWRNNVVLARSRVQGLGLYAARDIEKHTMIIEYIGVVIRNEIAERYERIHEANNRGIYMFRLDEDRVIDATLAGGLARYINHSCNPNCVAEMVEIERERKILIIANRKILKGEELGYDYKLAIEDDQHKISCLCGAATCKKWMN